MTDVCIHIQNLSYSLGDAGEWSFQIGHGSDQKFKRKCVFEKYKKEKLQQLFIVCSSVY